MWHKPRWAWFGPNKENEKEKGGHSGPPIDLGKWVGCKGSAHHTFNDNHHVEA